MTFQLATSIGRDTTFRTFQDPSSYTHAKKPLQLMPHIAKVIWRNHFHLNLEHKLHYASISVRRFLKSGYTDTALLLLLCYACDLRIGPSLLSNFSGLRVCITCPSISGGTSLTLAFLRGLQQHATATTIIATPPMPAPTQISALAPVESPGDIPLHVKDEDHGPWKTLPDSSTLDQEHSVGWPWSVPLGNMTVTPLEMLESPGKELFTESS